MYGRIDGRIDRGIDRRIEARWRMWVVCTSCVGLLQCLWAKLTGINKISLSSPTAEHRENRACLWLKAKSDWLQHRCYKTIPKWLIYRKCCAMYLLSSLILYLVVVAADTTAHQHRPPFWSSSHCSNNTHFLTLAHNSLLRFLSISTVNQLILSRNPELLINYQSIHFPSRPTTSSNRSLNECTSTRLLLLQPGVVKVVVTAAILPVIGIIYMTP